MRERWDAVVVGGGAMGTAAAWALARRGRRTLLLERFQIGHRRGSSHGPTRIFRFAYHHPDYVRLAVAARDGWRELERGAGENLLHTTGGLDVGPGAGVAAEALAEANVPFQWMRPEDAAERWPGLVVRAGERLLFQADAGVVSAGAALLAMARTARRAGAEIREDTPAEAVTPDGDGVEVRTPGGSIGARVAVLTAGAWMPALLPAMGLETPLALEVTREQVTYFEQRRPSGLPTLIEWPDPTDPGPARYAVPDPSLPGTLKLGEHLAGPVVDPELRTFDPDPVAEARVHAWAARRFAGLRPRVSETCLYTTTPDEDFVLDRLGPIVVGSACSGHGFKFAPLIGECLAALATGDPPPVPLERFRASRPSLAPRK
ncbi:MAG: N-methyl-L-tryptophan oxidase [Actinomycetota bacterium]|nr:N-methyl-L-tryptophan oxidase [Actinomycetota bacterium]